MLTAEGLEHHYVANTLCRHFALEAIIVHTGVRRSLGQQLRRHGVLRIFPKLAGALYRKAIGDPRQREAGLRRVLGADAEKFARQDLVRTVESINGPACLAIIKQINPDAILVYGTPVVKDPILTLAHDLAFNMHTGISPHYRGADCWFWPIVNGELHMIGATLHECTSAVDGGRIFGTAQARIERGDGMYELFGRAVAAGAEIYVQCVRNYLDGKLRGEPQDLSIGREYRVAMRTLGREMAARRAIRRGIVDEYVKGTPSP